MIKTGLVSITFRDLEPAEIIELVSKADLQAIEWGGDIHVPHGNVKQAKDVAKMTKKAGLDVAAYGSYYRVGCENEDIGSFEKVLKTAIALEAPLIRVWAGDKGSEEADEYWWKNVIEESRKIAEMAGNEDIEIAFEYHGGTLTDTDLSAQRLLKEVDHPNLYTYWQPPHKISVEERCQRLENILSWLRNVHVFYWTYKPDHEKHPLSEAAADWKKYLEIVDKAEEQHYAMLEFVKNDSPKQFLEDAKVLRNIVNNLK